MSEDGKLGKADDCSETNRVLPQPAAGTLSIAESTVRSETDTASSQPTECSKEVIVIGDIFGDITGVLPESAEDTSKSSKSVKDISTVNLILKVQLKSMIKE